MDSSHSGPSMTMNNSNGNVGIGNYKGVMLCNRPFGGSAVQNEAPKPDTRSFHAGIVPKEIGQTVSISSLTKNVARPKKMNALSKHRKWLADLQKTKDELEQKYINDMNTKQESQNKFSEREAAQRKLARSVLYKENEEAKDNIEPAEPKPQKVQKSELKASKEFSDEKGTQNKPPVTKKSNKPAWALTENAAAVASEDKEFEDEENLLDFAAGLNFDKYIDDLEIQTMMEKVKKRIMDLEREVVLEEKRQVEAADRAANRESNAEQTDEEDEENTSEDAEYEAAMAAARALLTDSSIRAVHSTKSISAMVKSAKDKDSKGEIVIKNQPIIVTHDETGGSRVDKNDVSNLPYIHRNPAV